jgi:hypothetical protein
MDWGAFFIVAALLWALLAVEARVARLKGVTKSLLFWVAVILPFYSLLLLESWSGTPYLQPLRAIASLLAAIVLLVAYKLYPDR